MHAPPFPAEPGTHAHDCREFVGEVQHLLELPGKGEAYRANRAARTTLGEQVQAGEASNLVGAFPIKIDHYLLAVESGRRFDFDEFDSLVAERAEVGDDEEGRPEAAYYAQAIVALLAEVVPGSEFEEVRDGLPEDEDYDGLLELVGVDEGF